MKKADRSLWPLPLNPYGRMIDGEWYRAEFSDGKSYRFWVVRELGPFEAQRLSVEFANGQHDMDVYKRENLMSVKKTKGGADGT
jgi:hypothetical protein